MLIPCFNDISNTFTYLRRDPTLDNPILGRVVFCLNILLCSLHLITNEKMPRSVGALLYDGSPSLSIPLRLLL